MLSITTRRPVAVDSLDHLHPGAVAFDNSIWPQFNDKVLARWPNVRLLDIGCAGGGLVSSIIRDGGFAVGIEGSDYPKRHALGEWAVVPGNLFTADATSPFTIKDGGKKVLFDIITAWEFFEHIPEKRIDGVMKNVIRHLSPDGVFIVSITTIPLGPSDDITLPDGTNRPAGIEYHVTVHDDGWWWDQLASYGFRHDNELTEYIDPDWVRGPENGCESSHAVLRLP